MATIIPLQATVAFEQKPAKDGNFYPCYILSNDRFIESLENALIITKSAIEAVTIEYETAESVLNGLSSYRVWRKEQEKGRQDTPTEINEHFGLLPDKESTISFPFLPANTPTEVLLYSYSDIKNITNSLKAACDALDTEGDQERLEQVYGIYVSFNDFLTSWEANKATTGSLYATEKQIQ